jgi:hypothetical protein
MASYFSLFEYFEIHSMTPTVATISPPSSSQEYYKSNKTWILAAQRGKSSRNTMNLDDTENENAYKEVY